MRAQVNRTYSYREDDGISQQYTRALRAAGIQGRGTGDHSANYRRFLKSPKLSELTGTRVNSRVFFQHSMLDGILHQLGTRLYAKLIHNRVFVKGHGALAHMEEVRDFLH